MKRMLALLLLLPALSLAQVTTNPAVTGVGIAASPTSGSYLKGNGTTWITSTGSASGTGACAANTWASTLNSDAAPTCTQPAAANLSNGTTGTGSVVLGTGPSATAIKAAASADMWPGDWVNFSTGYNTFTPSGGQVVSAIGNDASASYANRSFSNLLTVGRWYKLTLTGVTINSGQAPSISTGTNTVHNAYTEIPILALSAGTNSFVWKQVSNVANFYIWLSNSTDTNYSITSATVTELPMQVTGDQAISGNIEIGTMPVAANNAAAIALGLRVGALYRSGADPDVVSIVH